MEQSLPLTRHILTDQAAMAKSRGSAVAFALSQSNILRCLADHVYNKSDQKNLSLVSRTFRDAIASKLFSAIYFTRSGLQNGQYRPLSPHTRLCHCRTLRFVDDISGKEDSGLHKLSKFPPLSSTSAQKFLLTSVKHIMFQMPQLESFEWATPLFGAEYTSELLHALFKSRKLLSTRHNVAIRTLSLDLAGWASRPWLGLQIRDKFCKLRSLTLKGLPLLPEMERNVAQVLAYHPGLKILSLSTRCIIPKSLERLCDAFAALGAATPVLRLSVLELGDGFELSPESRYTPGQFMVATYLTKLLNTADLRSITFYSTYDHPIAWNTFNAAMMPRLAYFTPGFCKPPCQSRMGFEDHISDPLNHAFWRGVLVTTRPLSLQHEMAGAFGGVVSLPGKNYCNSWVKFHALRLLRVTVPSMTKLFKRLKGLDSLESLWIDTTRPPRTRELSASRSESEEEDLNRVALEVAVRFPNLRYLRIEVEIPEPVSEETPAKVARSWRVSREPCFVHLEMNTFVNELDEAGDRSECPRGFWDEERRINDLLETTSDEDTREGGEEESWSTSIGYEQEQAVGRSGFVIQNLQVVSAGEG